MAYCNVTLAGIADSCTPSIGGLKKVYIATYDDGIFTLDEDKELVTGIKSGVTWYEYSFKKNVCSMTSTLNVDPANGINYVDTELILQFNKMDTTKRIEIAALALGDMAVIVEDANGERWALGVSEPVNATAGAAQSGQAKGDGNFYSITLTDSNPTFPQALAPSVKITPAFNATLNDTHTKA